MRLINHFGRKVAVTPQAFLAEMLTDTGDMAVRTASGVARLPSSVPGYRLEVGLSGEPEWVAATPAAPAAHASTHQAGGSDELDLDTLGLPTGSVNFNGQQAVSLCIENRTSDPGSPAVGQIWLRTDL